MTKKKDDVYRFATKQYYKVGLRFKNRSLPNNLKIKKQFSLINN